MEKELTRIRRALHRIPEIGFDVNETRDALMEELSRTRAALFPIAGTGIGAYFDFGREETAAFRTDMDGLKVTEREDCPFASVHPGNMHACGHDAHMAMLVGLAGAIDQMKTAPKNALLLFQPAEESGGGGGVVVREGVLEKYRVGEIYAIHVDPTLPMGQVASRPGPMMALAAEVHVTVMGRAAHVAKWRDGVDALYAMNRFLARAYDAEARLPGEIPRLLKFGMLHGGSAVNILCDRAEAGGTLRAYDRAVHDGLKMELRQAAEDVQRETGAGVDVSFSEGYPAVINSEKLFQKAARAIPGLVRLPEPSLLAEDFGFYGEKAPSLLLFLGLGTVHPLHSPEFFVDDRALPAGVDAFLRLFQ